MESSFVTSRCRRWCRLGLEVGVILGYSVGLDVVGEFVVDGVVIRELSSSRLLAFVRLVAVSGSCRRY